MNYGDFKKAAKTNPIAAFLLELWMTGKAPLYPLIALFEKYKDVKFLRQDSLL